MKRCANANEGSLLIGVCQFSNALWICSFSNSTIPDSNSLRASGRDVVMLMLVACEAGGCFRSTPALAESAERHTRISPQQRAHIGNFRMLELKLRLPCTAVPDRLRG